MHGRPYARRVHGDRHRHRHPAGQAAADLRGLPAGRRDDQPPLRRHGPRALDQPRDRAAARRRDPRRQRRRAKARRSRCCCRPTPPPAPERGRSTTSRTTPATATPPPRCAPAATAGAVADDREQVAAGRPRRADRRQRRRPRDRPARGRARERASRGWWRMRPATALALAQEHRPDVIVLGLAGGRGARDARPPQARSAHAPPARCSRSPTRSAATTCWPRGAAGFLPRDAGADDARRRADRPRRSSAASGCARVLVVDDDDAERRSIAALIGGEDVEVETVASSEEALERARRDALRLHRARPQAAEGVGLRAARAGQGRRAPPQRAGDHPHRQGADPPRGDAAEALRRVDHRQGRRLAPSGCSTRRRCALHRPPESLPADGRRMLEQMRDADAALTGPQGADRRRRRAQRVRAHERARGARDGGRLRRERPRGARHACRPRPGRRPDPDGHHDARARRLRDDARRSARCPRSSGCRSSR